jgi:glutamate-1-semialdehyde 2,1-aminomutase
VTRGGERSAALFARATRLLPGGVSSPVRAFRSVGGTPVFFDHASGSRFTDADGREFIDFVMSWGPLLLGHAHPRVVEAVGRAAARGLTFGAPCEPELELAAAVIERYPAAERVRFVSSGTEAVMSAVRVARGFTERPIVAVFSGCYHGHSDGLLAAAGSGVATLGIPSSAGVPPEVTKNTAVLPLDDEAAFDRLAAGRGGELAAVLIEPLPANHGLLPQRPAFLEFLRRRCTELGALLVFDEVITGFRLARGGAAEVLGIRPDLATFGKVLGGGMPAGAFGGRAEVMERLAPEGPVYQAGTLSGNPLAMAAGLATLAAIDEDGVLARVEALGSRLERTMRDVIAETGVPASFVRAGSIFWTALQPPPAPRSAAGVDRAGSARYARLFGHALSRGVYLAPSAFEVGFLSSAHSEAEVDALAEALAGGLRVAFAEH